jgi:hypothetical protein
MEEKEKSVFRQLVDERLEKNKEDWRKAADEILRVLNKDKEFLEIALPEIMYCAVRHVVQTVGASPRSDYWKLKEQEEAVLVAQKEGRLCKKGEETRPSPYIALSFANPDNDWLVYQTKNGKKVGNCTGAEMEEEAKYFGKRATTYRYVAELYGEIAKKMKRHGDKFVKDVLSNRQIHKIAEAVVNGKLVAA